MRTSIPDLQACMQKFLKSLNTRKHCKLGAANGHMRYRVPYLQACMHKFLRS